MRKVPLKNYIILVVVFILVFLLTIALANLYNNQGKKIETNFFEFYNKIDMRDFNQYIIENPDAIIYISDRYDKSTSKFESKLKKYIQKNNLYDYVICIDKNNIDNSDKIKILDQKIDFSSFPIVIVVNDGKIVNISYVDINNFDISRIIDYKVFKW